MSGTEDLIALLQKGDIDGFNDQRRNRGRIEMFAVDLSGLTLTGANLSGIVLEKADLSAVTKFTQKHIAAGDGLDVVETRFELASKVQALKLLGDHLGLFKTAEKDMVSGLADALSRARRRVDNDMGDTG